MDNLESDSGQVRPTVQRQVADLELSVRKLWARLNSLGKGFYGTEFIFDYPAALTASPSDKYPVNSPFNVDEIQFTLRVPSSSGDVEVTLNRNDTVVGTYTIRPGVVSQVYSVSLSFSVPDTMWFEITGTGTGAEGLLCVVRLKDA